MSDTAVPHSADALRPGMESVQALAPKVLPPPVDLVRRGRARNRLVLNDVDWKTYTSLLRALDERHLRLTYDRGMLEIMTLSYRHESVARFLGRLAVTLSEEFDLPICEGGSTTLRRRRRQKGLEPDNCYWMKSAAQIQGKTVIDLRTDPPPDLAIEVDITSSSLNRMEIYARLEIPEVWRLDDNGLTFHALGTDKKYTEVPESAALSGVKPSDLVRFLELRQQLDDNAVIRQFRTWIRQKFGEKTA